MAFLRYLLGKRSELDGLSIKDITLARVVFDIHRERSHKKLVSVPLYALHQIHKLDRKNAIEVTRRRVAVLQSHRQELIHHRELTSDILFEFLPSVSRIKVVRETRGSFLAFEGNGRIAAMQSVFTPEDGILVEVERSMFRDPRKIIRRLNRIRRTNGLPVGDSG